MCFVFVLILFIWGVVALWAALRMAAMMEDDEE